nr:hypothetical protein [Tanacetum cinerariifolium]
MGSVLVPGGGGWKQEKRGAVSAGSRVYSALHSNFKKDGDGGYYLGIFHIRSLGLTRTNFSHTKELKKELSEKRNYKDVLEEFVQANVINEVNNFLPKFLPQVVMEDLKKTPHSLGQSSSQGQSAMEAVESLSKDDKDGDPLARSNQGKKTKKRRVTEFESSKKTSTTKESSKDDVEKFFNDEMDIAGQSSYTAVDVPQADVDPKIQRRLGLRILQSLKVWSYLPMTKMLLLEYLIRDHNINSITE